MELKQQLKTPAYKNWVKGSLALKYLSEELVQFVDTEIESISYSFLQDIGNYLSIQTVECGQCTTQNVVKCFTPGICRGTNGIKNCQFHSKTDPTRKYRKCPNDICNRVYEKIKVNHRNEKPSWKNSDVQLWCNDHWQIGKCYLPPDKGYNYKPQITDVDCAGLITIIQKCLSIQASLGISIDPPNDQFSKILHLRNEMFHSQSCELTDDQINDLINGSLAILKDKKKLINDVAAQNAVKKLNQLKEETFDISSTQLEDTIDGSSDVDMQLTPHSLAEKRQELQEKLTHMYEKHLTSVKLSPLINDIEASLDDFIVETVLFDETHDENMSGSDESYPADMVINEYGDFLTFNGNDCKNIYVVGDAGTGKTTWCITLLNTWVSFIRKKSESVDTEVTYTLNEVALSDFDFLFFIAFRHARDEVNVIDMIKAQLLDENTETGYLTEQLILKQPQKCLIVLDGLDEWAPAYGNVGSPFKNQNMPRKSRLQDSTFITTSRPWKMSDVPDRDIDRLLTIRGMESYHYLAEKIITRLNKVTEMKRKIESGLILTNSPDIQSQVKLKTYNTSSCEVSEDSTNSYASDKNCKIKTFDEFEKLIVSIFQNNIPTLLNIPLILMYMVCNWYDVGILKTTLTENYTAMLEYLLTNAEGSGLSCAFGSMLITINLQPMISEWIKSKDDLPKCFYENHRCKRYSGLILKLSELAFDSTLNNKTLVISKQSVQKVLSDDEITVCLKIGILSFSKPVDSDSVSSSTVTFLHKSIQEYLSAVHLVSASKHANMKMVPQIFEHALITSENMFELESILIFVCGLDEYLAHKHSKLIADRAWNCPSKSNSNDYNIYITQELPFKCAYEMKACGKLSERYPVVIYSALIDGNTNLETLVLQLDMLQASARYIQSFELKNCSEFKFYKYKTFGEYNKNGHIVFGHLKRYLVNCKDITDFRMTNLFYTESQTEWISKCISNLALLTNLKLTHVSHVSNTTIDQQLNIDLSHCKNIDTITCISVRFCYLTVCARVLKRITVEKCEKVHALVCTKYADSVDGLKYISFVESVECSLVLCNNNCNMNIEEILIENDNQTINNMDITSTCLNCVDQESRLSVLGSFLEYSSFRKKQINEILIDNLKCLSTTGLKIELNEEIQITDMQLQNIFLSMDNLKTLQQNLGSILKLQRLDLCYIRFVDRLSESRSVQINLSKCQTLQHFQCKELVNWEFTICPEQLETVRLSRCNLVNVNLLPIPEGMATGCVFAFETQNCSFCIKNTVFKIAVSYFEKNIDFGKDNGIGLLEQLFGYMNYILSYFRWRN